MKHALINENEMKLEDNNDRRLRNRNENELWGVDQRFDERVC
jgi:hypothetical protein